MIRHSPYYDAAHEAFRDQVRRFVRTEIEPYADEWDEAGSFPRELYRKAAQLGLLQLNYPEEFGGVPADRFYSIILSQELARSGAGGVYRFRVRHMPFVCRIEVRAGGVQEVSKVDNCVMDDMRRAAEPVPAR